MIYNRGGKALIVGDIGAMKVIRQQILLPGERLKRPTIKGKVVLSALRQKSSVYLDAQLECFAAPLRWFWDGWTAFIQEGIAGVTSIPVLTGATWTQNRARTTHLGIGHLNDDFQKFYAQMPIAVWNEWFRWREDAKISVDTPPISFYNNQGKECVNLHSPATRLHSAPVFDAQENLVPSATVLDLRDLAEYQARHKQAAVTDWTSDDRYIEFMRDVFNAPGSNEVDKVPIRLKKGARLSVVPQDQYATDGPSLGEQTSLNNFHVNHSWGDFIAPEHMIICFVALLRFRPILEDGVAPGVYPGMTNYAVYQGDPETFMRKPVPIASREIDGDGDDTVIGYGPMGWQLRDQWNHVDWTIGDLHNFPLMDGQTQTAVGFRDATKINSDTFRSLQLRHWFADFDFTLNVQSQVPEAGASIVAGADRYSGLKGTQPTGGHQL